MRLFLSKIKGWIFGQERINREEANLIINYRNRGKINFIDVGSVGGLPEPWRSHANHVRFLLNFEPNDAPSRGKNHLTYNTAVWERETTLPFYIYKGFQGTGSSLFKQNYEYVKENFEELSKEGPQELVNTWFDRSELIRTTKIQCDTIDNILHHELPDTPFHFMKIDAQGAEYNILKGAESLLSGSLIGLHLELFRIPLYKGIVLFNEVVEYLEIHGFELVKKFPAHGTFNSQHDCLFLKSQEDSSLASLIRKIYQL